MCVISLFKIVPRHSAEMLSKVPRHKQVVMCLTEKIHILDKAPFGHTLHTELVVEFDVSKSTICI